MRNRANEMLKQASHKRIRDQIVNIKYYFWGCAVSVFLERQWQIFIYIFL